MQVFPILIKNQQLPRDTVLNCRLLNKLTKSSVDEAICQQLPDGIREVRFWNMEDMQNVNARSEDFVGNPFITRKIFVHLSEEEEIQMALDIFHRFGHGIWSLHLYLGLVNPYRFWHQIS